MGNQSIKLANKLINYLPEQNKDDYSWDDRGMCRLFSDVFEKTLCFNSTAKEWFRWDGKRWVKDEGGMYAQKKAKIFAEALWLYALKLSDSFTQKDAFKKFVGKYGQYRNRKTLVDDARSERVITNADLDKCDNLFNCQNGIFDLNTFKLFPHDPKYLLSKISNVYYDPSAKSETWERFVDEIMEGDKEKTRFLQKVLALGITTDTSIEKMIILYGPTTRNGKSTILEVIIYMSGGSAGYALSVPPETLAKKNRDSRSASGDLARLDGCRLAVASEPPKRMLFDSALLKTMLGRDTIVARNLFEREFMFSPKFTLVMNTNYLPYVQDETMFTSERIAVIPFNRHFTPEEQDTTLKDKLKEKECISAIFNWCLDGLKLYRQEGLNPPESVVNATREYQESSDKIQMFLDECMVKSGINSRGGEVFEAFSEWCDANGFNGGSKMGFFEDMRSRGLLLKSGTIGNQTYRNVIKGYELADDSDPLTDSNDDLPFS